MIGLSTEIELGINAVIEGLGYDISLDRLIREDSEYEEYIGYNISAELNNGTRSSGELLKANKSSITIRYYAKQGRERVATEKRIKYSDIKRARVFEKDSDMLEADKMKAIIGAKTESFDMAKQMLHRWVGSPNAPSKEKLKRHVERLVEAGEKALQFLREALAYSIDYDALETHKIKSAIAAKPIILNGIFELDGSINELRQQLETDEINLTEKEFEIGYPERFAKGEFFPEKDYWKQWYNEEEDAVMICPHGTKGEILELEGLKVQLPEPPKNKKEILFHNLPKKEQYWRRQPVPENITPDNVENFHDYIIEEFRRRREGIWFMNNGEPTYLTGHAYFALQWGLMFDDGNYMSFRYAQLKMFYHLEACIRDPRCLGQIFLKSRRTGFTYVILFILLNMSTSKSNGKFGMTSKSGTDVQEAFDKFSYAFQNLPFFFRPVVKGKEDSPAELFFGKPSNNSKAAKKSRELNVSDYLNTVVDHRPTRNGSYDSVKLNGLLGDECFSPDTKILMEDLSFKEIKDVKVGDRVIVEGGKVIEVASTVSGEAEMFRVVQPYGKDYVVNGNHKIILEVGNSKKRNKEIRITPVEFLQKSEYYRSISRRKTFSGIELPEVELPMDPYMLGVWLGDGSSRATQFIVNETLDEEIYKEIIEYADVNKFEVVEREKEKNFTKMYLKDETVGYSNQFTGTQHRLKRTLEDLGIWGNKRIPEVYFHTSIRQRLELLSGLIDTDGHKSSRSKNQYNITMSRKGLVEDIYRLARLCGLDVSNVREKDTNFETKSYSVSITDYNAILNPRVERKKPTKTKVRNRRGKVEVVPEGWGEYCGITLKTENEEERALVLEDYTLSSNCGKWEKPNDYIAHLGQVTPTMAPNGRVVGKAFLGSTMGAHDKGGEQFIELIEGSYVKDRDPVTQKTSTGLYFYFLAAQDNMEQFTDKYGKCWTETPPPGTYNVLGEEIKIGSLEYLLAAEEQKRKLGDKALNEQYRTMPRTVEHAMRDESNNCVFNLTKLDDQMDYNATIPEESRYMTGNFEWKDGIKDGEVEFNPNPQGRFKVSWLPSVVDDTQGLANNVKEINGKFFPLNKDVVRFGCDPFSLKSTHGQGSKGAIHGKTLKFPQGGAPSNKFVVEYIARPPSDTTFFEDVIKVCRFYGAPILVESNRIDLLRHMRNRGYRPFAMDRVDRPGNKLNDNEKEYGGQVMSGQDMIDSHMNAIGSWIEDYVGQSTKEQVRPIGEMGDMPFDETLKDWKRFNPDKRTDFDATISSGLAIMACNTEKYLPKKKKVEPSKLKGLFPMYNNTGNIGRRIE